MLYFFKPFSTKKEIGIAYNSHCHLVPFPEDWILIQDYDAMILCSETFKVIESAIARYPDTAIFGALCNRVGYSHQRINPGMDENFDIAHHTRIAIDLAEKHKDGEALTTNALAGFFMLFRKSYWLESPFQDEIYDDKGNLFDWAFTRHALKNKLPMRIIRGAYLFHSYRLLKNFKDTTHLRTWHKDGSYT